MMKKAICVASALLFTAQPASADIVTVAGTNVIFTYDDLLTGLFGTPTVLGDGIYFTPVEFDVSSLNGAGFDFIKSTINIKVTPKAGFDLGSVALIESGDYLLLGSGTSVIATGQLRAFDLADSSVLSTASIISSLTETPGLPTQDWTASAGINLDTPAWIEGSGINLTLENILLASSTTANSVAFIEKKLVALSFSVSPSPVPEPSKTTLILAGLGLIGFVVRRRPTRFWDATSTHG
jgi:hypothetical protein